MHPVVDKAPESLTCVDTYGDDRVIAGTTDGALIVFKLKGEYESAVMEHKYKAFSKKALVQLTVLHELDMLLVLTDGEVRTYDLPSFKARTVLKAKGALFYAIDQARPDYPLCVATKKKLLMLSWDGGVFAGERELPVPDTPKCVVWAGDNVCLGLKRQYHLVDVHTGVISDLFPTGSKSPPVAAVLPSNELLVAKDTIGIFIGFDGKPTRKFGFNWIEPPVAIAYSFPYVLALLPTSVEIRLLLTQELVQTVKGSFTSILSRTGTDVFLASADDVCKLERIPVLDQVDDLVERGNFEAALTLCETMKDGGSEEDWAKVRGIHRLFALNLAKSSARNLDRALSHFSKAKVDVRSVIAMFPQLAPGVLSDDYRTAAEAKIELKSDQVAPVVAFLREARAEFADGDAAPLDGDALVRAQVIDTALLRAFLMTNDDYVSQFLSAPNHCVLDESETILVKSRRLPELVMLYKSKLMHDKALDVLARYAKGKDTPVFGVDETVRYLQDLGPEHEKLVLQYAKWVLATDPDKGLEIFTHESDTHAPISHAAVLQLLPKRLVIAFLEHCIHRRGEKGADFHNQLILEYLDSTLTLLQTSAYQSMEQTSRPRAGDEGGQLGAARTKLLDFLSSSTSYTAEKMLVRFPEHDLYQERALLLSRIRRHEQVLNIYARRLGDVDMAEEYCKRYYDAEDPETKDIYLSLLQAYLPDDEGKKMNEAAIRLLNTHFEHIDAARALRLLPLDTPLHELESFFQAYFQHTTLTKRNNQIMASLHKADKALVHEKLLRARSKMVQITPDRVCKACRKRIGTSVFSVYPNGTVVHFVCSKDRTVDPVTGQVFGKNSNEE